MASSEVLYQRGEDDGSDAWDDSALIKAYDNAISVMKAKLVGDNPELVPQQSSSKAKKKKKGKSKKKQASSQQKWKSGDRCQAVYTEDGEVYEARIMSVDQDGGTCVVQYIGYGNEEEQLLSDLLPPGSGPSSVKTDTASETESIQQPPSQESHKLQSSRAHCKRSSSSRQNGGFSHWGGEHTPFRPMMPPPPPPPLHSPYGHMPPPPPFGQMPSHQAAMFPPIPPPPPLFSQPNQPGDDNEALYSMLISWYMSGYHTGYYQGLRQGSSSGSSSSRLPR